MPHAAASSIVWPPPQITRSAAELVLEEGVGRLEHLERRRPAARARAGRERASRRRPEARPPRPARSRRRSHPGSPPPVVTRTRRSGPFAVLRRQPPVGRPERRVPRAREPSGSSDGGAATDTTSDGAALGHRRRHGRRRIGTSVRRRPSPVRGGSCPGARHRRRSAEDSAGDHGAQATPSRSSSGRAVVGEAARVDAPAT